MGLALGVCRGNSGLVFIYLFGLDLVLLLNLLYPKVQLSEHNNGCSSALSGPEEALINTRDTGQFERFAE